MKIIHLKKKNNIQFNLIQLSDKKCKETITYTYKYIWAFLKKIFIIYLLSRYLYI